MGTVMVMFLVQSWFQPSQKGNVKAMKGGMGKGRLSFHLSACFLVSFPRLFTSPGSQFQLSGFFCSLTQTTYFRDYPVQWILKVSPLYSAKAIHNVIMKVQNVQACPASFVIQKLLSISSIIMQIMRGSSLLLHLMPFVCV